MSRSDNSHPLYPFDSGGRSAVPWLRPPFLVFREGADDELLRGLAGSGVPHEIRTHEPPRHARHLASIWGAALAEAGRATLFMADERPVLAVVPADRKVTSPAFRELVHATDLRVLRADRGVGRLGWLGMPGEPGILPALPTAFDAESWVDSRVLELRRLIVSIGAGRSVSLLPADYVRLFNSTVERFTGSTRLLPEGGMIDDT